MKKRAIIITLLILAFALCACDVNTYSIEKIGDVLESSADVSVDEEQVTFTAEIPTEEFLENTDYYFLFDDESGEYTKVLFKTDYTVTDLKYFTVQTPQITVMGAKPIKDEIIFTMRSLSPDKPFVVDVKSEIGSSVASRGVSFVDPDGVTHYYLISAVTSSSVVIESVEMADHSGIIAELPESEFLENAENYISYEDKKEEYTKILYKTPSTVTSFRFLSIEPVDTDKEDGRFKIVKVLDTVEEFGPEKPFVAETAFADVYPMRGISFVDGHGITRYFTVSDSAKDGEIFIEEVPPMTE